MRAAVAAHDGRYPAAIRQRSCVHRSATRRVRQSRVAPRHRHARARLGVDAIERVFERARRRAEGEVKRCGVGIRAKGRRGHVRDAFVRRERRACLGCDPEQRDERRSHRLPPTSRTECQETHNMEARPAKRKVRFPMGVVESCGLRNFSGAFGDQPRPGIWWSTATNFLRWVVLLANMPAGCMSSVQHTRRCGQSQRHRCDSLGAAPSAYCLRPTTRPPRRHPHQAALAPVAIA